MSFSFTFWKSFIMVNLFVLKTRRTLMFFKNDDFALECPFFLWARSFIDSDQYQLVLILIFVLTNFSFFDLIREFLKALLLTNHHLMIFLKFNFMKVFNFLLKNQTSKGLNEA